MVSLPPPLYFNCLVSLISLLFSWFLLRRLKDMHIYDTGLFSFFALSLAVWTQCIVFFLDRQ